MSDCIFCKIIEGEIPSEKVYEDEEIFAFEDIDPRAPVHVLVVPREHIPTLNDVEPAQDGLLGRMVLVATRIAGEKDVADSGYRILMNCNKDGGQEVFHLHLHMIGGRSLGPMVQRT